MSSYKVKIGDREYQVKILREYEGLIEVDIEGTIVSVSVSKPLGEKERELKVTETPKFETRQPQSAITPPPRPITPTVAAPGVIASKVPGKIKDVKVVEGQSVKRGETLLIMESMKMEIEVKADRDGVVKTVHVRPGQFVSPGAPLVLIE